MMRATGSRTGQDGNVANSDWYFRGPSGRQKKISGNGGENGVVGIIAIYFSWASERGGSKRSWELLPTHPA